MLRRLRLLAKTILFIFEVRIFNGEWYIQQILEDEKKGMDPVFIIREASNSAYAISYLEAETGEPKHYAFNYVNGQWPEGETNHFTTINELVQKFLNDEFPEKRTILILNIKNKIFWQDKQ